MNYTMTIGSEEPRAFVAKNDREALIRATNAADGKSVVVVSAEGWVFKRVAGVIGWVSCGKEKEGKGPERPRVG